MMKKWLLPAKVLWSARSSLCHLASSSSSSSSSSFVVPPTGVPLAFWTAIRGGSTASTSTAPTTTTGSSYEVRSAPAPGSPFHYAFPVHSLAAAKEFYGTVLGCEEGRSSDKWQDFSLHGHQIVCHWVGDTYRCVDYYNPVDGDEVPVPRE
jgi:hypothetical protein